MKHMLMSTRPFISASAILTLCAMHSTPNTAGQRTSEVRSDISAAQIVSAAHCECDAVRVGGFDIVYKHPSERWDSINPLPQLLLLSLVTSIAITPTGATNNLTCMVTSFKTVHRAMSTISFVTNNRGACHSARWQRYYSPELCWISMAEWLTAALS